MSRRGEKRKKAEKQALRAQRYKAKLVRDAEAERNRNPPHIIPPGTIARDSSGQPIGIVTGSTGLMQMIPSGWADFVRPVVQDFQLDIQVAGDMIKKLSNGFSHLGGVVDEIRHTYHPPEDDDNGPEPIAKMK